MKANSHHLSAHFIMCSMGINYEKAEQEGRDRVSSAH